VHNPAGQMDHANCVAPQWSPPVMGGMTPGLLDRLDRDHVPQWSPPVMGGMTPARPGHLPVLHLPQWSPPVMGGMTPDSGPSTAGDSPKPQWSPPVMGGMTRGRAPTAWSRCTSRNGAR